MSNEPINAAVEPWRNPQTQEDWEAWAEKLMELPRHQLVQSIADLAVQADILHKVRLAAFDGQPMVPLTIPDPPARAVCPCASHPEGGHYPSCPSRLRLGGGGTFVPKDRDTSKYRNRSPLTTHREMGTA